MELLSVQKAALKASTGMPGFGFFMEQGLGKTLTTYAEFMELVASREATRLVVVCPNSFKQGWVEEAIKYSIDLDFFVWQAGMIDQLKCWADKKFTKPPCIIVNWESIRAAKTKVGKRTVWDSMPLLDVLKSFTNPVRGRAMVAFDESIQAKTHDSAQTKGGIFLQDPFAYSRILSGKPITQGPHDLWGQLRLIKQMQGRNYFAFKTAFCRMGGFMNKTVIGAQNEDVLAEMINPYIFRATKADWTDLPPKSYTTREYTMTPEMKSMYKQMEQDFVLWLNEDQNVSVDAAITKYIKLVQIQCGWIYDEAGKVHWLVDDAKNPRLNLLKEVIETEVVGKVCIPYNHKPVFDQLLRNLGGEDECAWITGGMKPEEVEEQKRRFNKEAKVTKILLQTKASKYGHTLLGDQSSHETRCCTMIPYENTYSLDDRSQIEDRTHRHGQFSEMMSYIDLVGTPMDRNCVRALQRKESVFQAVFKMLKRRQ